MTDALKELRAPRGGGSLGLGVSACSFLAILLLAVSSPYIEMSGYFSPDDKAWRPWAYVAVFVLQLAFVNPVFSKRARMTIMTPLFVAIAWCWLSLVWSAAPFHALRNLVLLTIVCTVLFLSVTKLGYRRALTILRVVFAFAMMLNLFTVLALPQTGLQLAGAHVWWRGFMAHKNIAGMLSSLTILLFALDVGRIPRFVRYPIIAGCTLFLIESFSRTSWIGCGVSLVFGLAITRFAKPLGQFLAANRIVVRRVGIGLCVGVLLLLIALTIQRDFLLSLTDNTTALSQRNLLWRPLTQYYLAHPMLGAGFGSYWVGGQIYSDPRSYGVAMWLVNVDQAHNGYLDLLVQVGIPGLVLALGATFVWASANFGWLVRDHGDRAALIFGLICFCFIDNLTESSLLEGETLCNVALVISLALIRRLQLVSDWSSTSEAAEPVLSEAAGGIARLSGARSMRPE